MPGASRGAHRELTQASGYRRQIQRGGNLFLEELSPAPVLWIDPAQQLSLVEAKADSVICLPCARCPGWFLPCQDLREPIDVGDDALVHRLIEGEQCGLMRQELPDSNSLLVLLSKLRPVGTDTFVVIQQAPRMRKRLHHRGQSLGGREYVHHSVQFPMLSGGAVTDPAPEINGAFTLVVNATRRAEFVPVGEILDERFTHFFESWLDESFNLNAGSLCHGVSPASCSPSWRETIPAHMGAWERSYAVFLGPGQSARSGVTSVTVNDMSLPNTGDMHTTHVGLPSYPPVRIVAKHPGEWQVTTL